MSAQDHQSTTAASTNRKTFTKAHFKALTEETTAANGNILVKERVRESRPGSPTQEGYGTGSSFAYHKTGASASARISGSKANKSNTQHHKAKQFTTLQHIDDILDDLNFSSREMATERLSSTLPARKLNSQGNGNGNGNGNGRGKGIGAGGGVDVSGVKDELTYKGRQGLRKGNSSSTGISNLIQMVDEVVSKLS